MGFGFLIWVMFLSMLCQPLSSQLQPNTDRYFVSDFLQKMGFDSVQHYNFSAPICSWPGVFCDAEQEQEHVVKLIASGLGLSGPIPDTTIGKLSKLQHLDLSNNRITAFCSDFWSLGSLKSLNLSKNRISGPLPSNIGNFGKLEMIDLSLNDFTGEIPAAISSLDSLEVLNLAGNRFEYSIPSGIRNCRSLVSIDMSSNMFNGSLPDGFSAAFPKLKFLNIADNEIRGRDTDFSSLASLTDLNVSGNLFQGSVARFFRGMLEVIDLSRNQFQGHVSEVQSNWSRLVYLDLSENELSGQILHNLSSVHNLKHLNLAANRFSKQLFPRIEMLSGLEYLNLSGANLKGRIPIEIKKLRNLKVLDLSKNNLDGQIPFFGIKNLQSLDLSRNNLTGEVPVSVLDKLPYMESFDFSYNNLTVCADGVSPETLKTAFFGSTNSCPIAANPNMFQKHVSSRHTAIKIAIALTLSVLCLMVGLIFLVFGCRRKNKNKNDLWTVKQAGLCKEEPIVSGPFSFRTDLTTWVADVKSAATVPVVIFEKPLLTITFADLLSATSGFDRGTLLAEGKFGPVYRGVLPGGFHVAVKVLVHGSTLADHEAGQELEYLGRIKHPNVVPLTGYCLAGDQRIAIYEYMENGNLQNLLHDLPLGIQIPDDWSGDTWEEDGDGIRNAWSVMTWRFRHKIAVGTARALAFLHHGCYPSIIHRDVKASSIYLDYNLEPRLSDFGLAKVFGNGIDEEITRGSPGYYPPEFTQPENDAPTAKSDVYCFGVVLFELVTGKKPVGDDYGEGNVNLVGWVRGLVRKNHGLKAIDPKIRDTGPDEQMEEALKIGFLCTADHPSKRPSMQQVVGLLKDIEPSVV